MATSGWPMATLNAAPTKGTREVGDNAHQRRLERGMETGLRHQHGGNRCHPRRTGQVKKIITQRGHRARNGGFTGREKLWLQSGAGRMAGKIHNRFFAKARPEAVLR